MGGGVAGVYAQLAGALDAVCALPEAAYDTVGAHELLGLLEQLEVLRRRVPGVEHTVLARLGGVDPAVLGAKNLTEATATRLRISSQEARVRIKESRDLGPRRALTGEPLSPTLAATAAARADGLINIEHVAIIRRFFRQLPRSIDHRTRQQAEQTLVGIAAEHGPEALSRAAHRLTALLDPDGVLPDDADRARQRSLIIGPQRCDGMSPISGMLDPEARATLDAVLAKLAAPGMCNPDDEVPCTDSQPDAARARQDSRSQAQRNHDGLKALARTMLASGELGEHNGLPATIVVSTTLAELESAGGHAVTGSGSLLPMSDVIRIAAHAHHYLVVFDSHRQVPLYLGRAKRSATPGQRIVLHARDRGCSHPACTVPGYACQVHHVTGWASGGRTDIDQLTLACGPHNRLVEKSGWTTRQRRDGIIEWIPPPPLDNGRSRVNVLHHPHRLLAPDPSLSN